MGVHWMSRSGQDEWFITTHGQREREKESWSGQSQFAKDADVQRCTYNTGPFKRQHRKSEEEVHSKMENGRKKGGKREKELKDVHLMRDGQE